ncbi:MAG: DNA topoisomerase VI subunit B [Candidatus Thermoplasmatota archaeon]|nr:DNA topoisomerase VI subunit B [Candidatus Thermoplasmatota archaeon]
MQEKKKPQEFKQVSISEFFEKNRHILGFDSLQRALFIMVKEAVDNSLDACEEHGILPDLDVKISRISGDIYEMVVLDNGPGIERTQVPKAFGQLLYGSRFHVMRQTRGQQGLGITAAILYGQITTGEFSHITTKRPVDDVAYHFEMGIDIKNNVANIKTEEPVIWKAEHGTEVRIRAKGKYITGRQSIHEYLKEVAVVNPNARIRFTDPDGTAITFERSIEEPSRQSKPVKPHPYGLEVGELLSLASESSNRNMKELFVENFSRISLNTASEILEKSGVDPEMRPAALERAEAERIISTISEVKLMPPSAESLSPISEQFIRVGMLSVYGDERPGFYGRPISGSVRIHKGNPFSVEIGMVYGGELPSDQPARIIRYANKVPLLFQAGSCAITEAISETDWRQYGMEQKQGKGVPYGPAIILVHVYGPKIPYVSESKEAIAPVSEIVEEIKNVLKAEMRQLRRFNNRIERNKKMGEKFRLVSKIIPEIAKKSSEILKLEVPDYRRTMSKIANVVFVREEVENGDKKKSITSVINYTDDTVSFNLKIVFPFREVDIKIENLESAETYSYEEGLDQVKGNYTGAEYFVTGINPVLVQGAEELPADWDLKGVEVNEQE